MLSAVRGQRPNLMARHKLGLRRRSKALTPHPLQVRVCGKFDVGGQAAGPVGAGKGADAGEGEGEDTTHQ